MDISRRLVNLAARRSGAEPGEPAFEREYARLMRQPLPESKSKTEFSTAYIVAKQTQAYLEKEFKDAVAEYKKFGGGSGDRGLTPDSVRNKPGFRKLRNAKDAAFQTLRRHNTMMGKKFGAEMRADRKYGESVSEAKYTRLQGRKVRLTVKKKDDEWCVCVYVDGKYSESLTYYGSDRPDAVATQKAMRAEFKKKGAVMESASAIHDDIAQLLSDIEEFTSSGTTGGFAGNGFGSEPNTINNVTSKRSIKLLNHYCIF